MTDFYMECIITLMQCYVQVESMKEANRQREALGQSTAYQEASFVDILNELERLKVAVNKPKEKW
jgi:hypothetical protein